MGPGGGRDAGGEVALAYGMDFKGIRPRAWQYPADQRNVFLGFLETFDARA